MLGVGTAFIRLTLGLLGWQMHGWGRIELGLWISWRKFNTMRVEGYLLMNELARQQLGLGKKVSWQGGSLRRVWFG